VIYLPPPQEPWRVDQIGAAFLKAVICLASLPVFAFGVGMLCAL
jgi:hypothetical protein